MKDNNVLLKEITIFTPESGEDNHHERERMYDLTIGNVEIKRGGTLDSIQVFMNGVLQKTAGEIITNTSDSTASIFNHRDILLKFDDGTSAKLSELLSPSIVQLKTLVTSLHDMLFAENVVDYIAFSIYFNSRGDY